MFQSSMSNESTVKDCRQVGGRFEEHLTLKSLYAFGTCLSRFECVYWEPLRDLVLTLCCTCAALVPGDYVHEVALMIFIIRERPRALTVSCGAIAVPRRSIYIYTHDISICVS